MFKSRPFFLTASVFSNSKFTLEVNVSSNDTFNKVISSRFKDIDDEIEKITNDNNNIIVEKPTKKFQPIPIDKEDGFYSLVDYTYSTEDKDIKLEDNPSLTSKDILEVKNAIAVYRAVDDGGDFVFVEINRAAEKFENVKREDLIGKRVTAVFPGVSPQEKRINRSLFAQKGDV